MKKELIINMIAQVFMFAVNLGISFFLVPYITKIIGVEAYGFVGLANDFVGYAQIITIAINSMAARFITIKIHENKIKEANKNYSSVILSNLLISVVLGLAGIVFISFMEYFIDIPKTLVLDVKLLFSFIFANFIISIMTSTFSVATFCTNKLYLTSIKTIISQILRVIILFAAFLFFKPSVFYVGLAALASTAYLGYCNYKYSKTLTPELKISKKYFEFKYIKTLISSGIWNTFSRISGILSSGLDLLISNLFIGSTGMGIISLSKTIPNTILNAFGTITNVFNPELTISYAKKDYEDMKRQLLFAIKLLGLIAAIPMVGLIVYGQDFYRLWVPTQNASILYNLTVISIVGLSFCLPLEPLWNIFTVTNKVKQSSIYLISNSIITILVVFVLLNIFPNGNIRMYIIVSVSVVFTILRSLTFLPLYGAKCLNMKLTTFYPNIYKNIIVIVISSLILYFIKIVVPITSWMSLMISAAFATIIILLISSTIILDCNDREKIYDKIIKPNKRRSKNENK